MEKRPKYVFTNELELKVGTPEYKKFRTWLAKKGYHHTRNQLDSLKPEYLTEYLKEYRSL